RLARDRELIDRISFDLSGRVSLDEVFDRFLDHIMTAFPLVDFVFISLLDSETLTLRGTHAAGDQVPDNLLGYVLDPKWSIAAQSMEKLTPIVLDISNIDKAAFEGAAQNGIADAMIEFGRSHPNMGVLGIPIVAGDERVGALTLVCKQGVHIFDDHMRDLLVTICRQVGLYMQNVHLMAAWQSQSERLEAVLNSASEAIVLIDPKGNVLLRNARYHELFEPGGILNAKAQRKLSMMLLISLESHTRTDFVFDLDHPASDDPTILEVSGARVQLDGELIGMVATMRDTTVVSKHARDRSELLSYAKHEIGTPIEAITTFTQFLLENHASLPDDQVDETLSNIKLQALEASQLVGETLEYSNIKEAILTRPRVRVELSFTALQIASETEALLAQQGLNFEYDIEPDIWVMGNTFLLKQALRNLLDNARKYTPQEGTITFSLDQIGKTARIQVTDTGIGISEDDQPHIFTPYYRADTRDESSGSGLGLSIVRDVVDAHRGRITVSSRLGEGTQFSIALLTVKSPL
ncbi:MAG: ATP-binding protein, partial [Chloroflexota bacterium]